MESPSIPANYSFRRVVLRTEITGDGNGTGDSVLCISYPSQAEAYLEVGNRK